MLLVVPVPQLQKRLLFCRPCESQSPWPEYIMWGVFFASPSFWRLWNLLEINKNSEKLHPSFLVFCELIALIIKAKQVTAE